MCHNMFMNDGEVIKREMLHRMQKSIIATKGCYVMGCTSKTIKAHSVSNNRLLKRISRNGEVMYLNVDQVTQGLSPLSPTGRSKATTFPGFCDLHDKFFVPIDNDGYQPGEADKEYLFAMRAHAREYSVRTAMQHFQNGLVDYLKSKGMSVNHNFLETFGEGYAAGTKDVQHLRPIFNVNHARRRYWKIKSEVLVLDNAYPIVASSSFKLEMSPDDKIITDLLDLKAKQTPIYLTVFPQDGKTYCILSWHHNDDSKYGCLRGLSNKSESEKRVIISNLLTAYVENLAVNPDYWSRLPVNVRKKYDEYQGLTMRGAPTPFVYDPEYSLFVDEVL